MMMNFIHLLTHPKKFKKNEIEENKFLLKSELKINERDFETTENMEKENEQKNNKKPN